MTQWWDLAIPAVAGVAGAILGALAQAMSSRRLYAAGAEERRKARFVEERRAAYIRFLAAFSEWEPLRAEAWRLRDEMDHSQDKAAAEKRWMAARTDSEPSFRRLLAAEQEIQIIAPKPVREAATSLFVEACRIRAVMRFREEFITVVRVDLGTDADPAAAMSALLASGALYSETNAL